MTRTSVFSCVLLLSTLVAGCDDGKEKEAPVQSSEKADAPPVKAAEPEGAVADEPKQAPAPKSDTPTEQEIGAMLKGLSTPNWSKAAMMKKAHSRILADGGEAVVSGMMEAYAEALGPVQSLTTPPVTLKVGQAKDKAGDDVQVVVYKAEVAFEKSKGEINARLMLDDGEWRIVLLSVESVELDALMKKMEAKTGEAAKPAAPTGN